MEVICFTKCFGQNKVLFQTCKYIAYVNLITKRHDQRVVAIFEGYTENKQRTQNVRILKHVSAEDSLNIFL